MKARKLEVFMNNDTKIAVLENTIVHINETLVRMESRFDKIDEKFDRLDEKFSEKFDKMDNKIDCLRKEMYTGFSKINERLWSNFIWLMSLTLTLAGGVAGLIARSFHLI
jgi:uncharacterized coiled-coil protein SlyX